MITTAEIINDMAGICKNIFASAANSTKRKPTIKKPPIKLKSFRVASAYADNPINITPVPPNDNIMIFPPLGNEAYMLSIGPNPNPSIPVMRKTIPIPADELAKRGRTNMAITIPPITDIMYVIGGIFMNIESAAVRPLNNNVRDKSIYVLRNTLFVAMADDDL